VLNGGWEKGLADGRPISTDPASFPRSSFKASTGAQRGVASRADVLASNGVVHLIDNVILPRP